jgi:arsenical pump membrane protein
MAALIWIISLASIALMLLRPRGLPEWVWIGAGALLLVATGLLPLSGAAHAIGEGLDVYLFLAGMMMLAELAREEGVFDWVAGIAVHHARGSSAQLFFWIYLSGTIVTAFLSNDATAVVLTPAVLAAVRRARVDPRPHLMACALVANAASFVFPISNPANLVVFGAHMPALGSWLRSLAVPSVAAIVATYLALRLLSRKALDEATEPVTESRPLSAAGKLALAGILIAAAGLLISSGFGIALGAPTCAAGVLALVMVAVKDRTAPLTALRQVAWSVLPLVAGLFMIVEALNRAGMARLTRLGTAWLARSPDGLGKFAGAGAVALLSNGMNNLPVALAAGSALRHAGAHGVLARALLLGVDLGPNLSVTGSLATILWLIALRREGAEITPLQFLKVGLIAMPAALVLALLALR